MFQSLSARLLLLTVAFVMLAEVAIFVPSIAQFRRSWLEDHLALGQIAGLALEATPNAPISNSLEQELLANAMVRGVILKRAATKTLMLREESQPTVRTTFDLRDASWIVLIVDALALVLRGPEGVIQVIGSAFEGGGEYVAILVDEQGLYDAMVVYGRNILLLSIVISLITAGLLYISLSRMFLRPMKRLTSNMVAFSEKPQEAARMIVPSGRRDEIGTAEKELRAMQADIGQALLQKSHLANLGEAVARINHDLRNILTTVQLTSGRLAKSNDQHVQQLSVTLAGAIDRAIALCTQTLNYGKATAPVPRPVTFDLHSIVEDIGPATGLPIDGSVLFENQVDAGFEIHADPDMMFRALQNLTRNACQAIEAREDGKSGGTIIVKACHDGPNDLVEVIDTGPGLPAAAQEQLFKPFLGSTHSGGTGLGLANVQEVLQAHGGDSELVRSGPDGTVFRLVLPR